MEAQRGRLPFPTTTPQRRTPKEKATRWRRPWIERSVLGRPVLPHSVVVPAVVSALTLAMAVADPGGAEMTSPAAAPMVVSPGALDRIVTIEDRCPTFNWSRVEGAQGYELRLYRLSERGTPADDEAEMVFRQTLPGGAVGWSPSLEHCLEPGVAYAWVVRALTRDAAVESPAGDWSEPGLLEVAVVPPAVEPTLEKALVAVAAYLAAGGRLEGFSPVSDDGSALGAGSPGSFTPIDRSPDRSRRTSAAEGSGVAALSGQAVDPTGEAYGVEGISHSPDGAGVRAENLEPTAPDLVLVGQPSTRLNESTLLRESDTDTHFTFANPGAGSLTLWVDGDEVVTTSSDQNTEYSAGNQLQLSGTTFDVSEGPGSGLDADSLDGLDSGSFANAALLAAHLGDFGNPHQVVASQTTPTVARGDLEIHDGTAVVRLPAGATGQLLRTNPAAALGVDWSDPFLPAGQACPPLSHVAGFHPDGSLLCRPVRPRPLPVELIKTLDSVGDVGDQSSIAIGADGLPVIAYSDTTNVAHKVAHCDDPLCASATLSTLDDTGFVTSFPSIAIGSDGLPLVAYSAVGDLRVAHCHDVACTSATSTTLDPGGVGAYLSMAIGQDGRPVISYWKAGGWDLYVAHCDDSVCSSATLSAVDVVGNVGRWCALAIGADGLPIISYHDDGNEDLKVAHCEDLGCATATLTTVDSAGATGSDSSIAVGSDGLPIISYHDATTGALRVAQCQDLSCSVTQRTTVDSVSGTETSIAIGTDGLPVIAYRGNAGGFHDLAVAHCDVPSCSSATLTFVDTTGTLLGPSIAIGVDGLPVISYSDFTHRDLKTVHCQDANCS